MTVTDCHADVLELLDAKCSGRQECMFQVRKLYDISQPCPRDYTSYLEVAHRCVKGWCIQQY